MKNKKTYWGVFFLLWLGPVVLVNPAGDYMEDAVLATTVSIVDRHTLQISPHSTLDISRVDEKYYSGFEAGAEIIAVPFYLLFKPLISRLPEPPISLPPDGACYERPCALTKEVFYLRLILVWTLMGPLLGFFGMQVARYADKHGTGGYSALGAAYACSMGTLVLCYSCVYSRMCLSNLIVWNSFLWFLNAEAPGARALLVLGALMGIAVTVHYMAILLVGMTGVFMLWRLEKTGRLACLSGMLPWPLLVMIFHWLVFGSPLSTPYRFRVWPAEVMSSPLYNDDIFHFNPMTGFSHPTWESLFGLTVSPYKGVFLFCPVLLCGIYGYYAVRKNKRESPLMVYSLAMFFAQFLFVSSMKSEMLWSGTPIFFGPRYLLAALPLVALGGIHAASKPKRLLAAAAACLSIGIGFLGCMFQDKMTPLTNPILLSPIKNLLKIFLSRGPRIPFLELYGIAPAVQAAVFAAYLAVVFLPCYSEGMLAARPTVQQ